MSADVPVKPVSYQSRFGGTWPDLSNAHEILAGKIEMGMVSEEEAALVRFWIENGFVVIEKAVDPAVIDEAKRGISRVYEEGRAFVETYEFNDVRIVRVEPRHRVMQHKLIDAYAHAEELQTMIVSQKITRFLSIIFGEAPLAFQGLYFENGSRQAIHQDTAYVRVNRPIEFAGTWIAMEDIKEGSGELEYYVGSHRISEFLFNGTSKWLPHVSDEHPAFLAHIASEAERLRLVKERFRPKKGDALVWNADLCHGGSTVTNPVTRQSFVTHWCPATARPYYFDVLKHSGKKKIGDKAFFSYSFHGNESDPYS